MPGVTLTMDEMKEFRSDIRDIRAEQGEFRTGQEVLMVKMDHLVNDVKQGFTATNDHLRTLNGRTGKSEERITALEGERNSVVLGWKTLAAVIGSAGTLFAGLSWLIKHLDH